MKDQQNHFDVIVIGAGMAGLTCAAKLQKEGKKVLLLEQHNKVGGYCTNFKRRGYEFETSIHFIVGCEPGGMLYDILEDCGAEKYVSFIKLDPVMYKAIYPDRTIKIPSTIEEFKALLNEGFPGEKENIDRYFNYMVRLFNFGGKMIDKRTSNLRRALAPVLDFRSLLALMSNMNKSFGDYLNRDIQDHKVREIVSQLWAFLGVPPSRLSMLFFIMGLTGYYVQGAYYIDGGSQCLSDAFAKAFKENGGTLLTRTDATRITIKGGKATGVEVLDKHSQEKSIYTSQLVISCADATHTYMDLVGEENLPAKFIKKLKSLKPAISCLGVYLGVDMILPDEFKNDFDVFVYKSYDSESAFQKMKSREGIDAFALSFYSNICPQFSPEPGKKHVISLLSCMDLDEKNMQELWKISDVHQRGEAYKNLKKQLGDELIDLAEEILPGLKNGIEVKEIATPVTMKRYTKNLNGSILGWENSVDQSLLRRMKQKTPVKNLYMASAWTFPGGGVNGATFGGSIVADRVMRKIK